MAIPSAYLTSSVPFHHPVYLIASLQQAIRNGQNEATSHEGSLARTDSSIRVHYPKDDEMPASVAVQGRGGLNFKRTLPSFSFEGKVTVITGGARGLGLVMGQAAIIGGADIAIVDLNSMLSCLANYCYRITNR